MVKIITAVLLMQHGIFVFDEDRISSALDKAEEIEKFYSDAMGKRIFLRRIFQKHNKEQKWLTISKKMMK